METGTAVAIGIGCTVLLGGAAAGVWMLASRGSDGAFAGSTSPAEAPQKTSAPPTQTAPEDLVLKLPWRAGTNPGSSGSSSSSRRSSGGGVSLKDVVSGAKAVSGAATAIIGLFG